MDWNGKEETVSLMCTVPLTTSFCSHLHYFENDFLHTFTHRLLGRISAYKLSIYMVPLLLCFLLCTVKSESLLIWWSQ